MANSKTATVLRWLLLGFGVAFLIFLAGGVVFMLDCTVVNPWLLFGVIGVMAVISGGAAWPLWSKLTSTRKVYINFPVHVIVFTIIAAAIFLFTNYFAADYTAYPPAKASIERVYWQQRYRTRRVSRRTYVRGAPYKVYFLDIALAEDGTVKKVPITKTKYDLAHKGDSVELNIGKGFFGCRVINESSLKLLNPRSNKKSRRCKFVGTSGGKTQEPDWARESRARHDSITTHMRQLHQKH